MQLKFYANEMHGGKNNFMQSLKFFVFSIFKVLTIHKFWLRSKLRQFHDLGVKGTTKLCLPLTACNWTAIYMYCWKIACKRMDTVQVKDLTIPLRIRKSFRGHLKKL